MIMNLIDWACEVEGKVLIGEYPWEEPPLIFTHWAALFVLMVYVFLFRLGFVSDE